MQSTIQHHRLLGVLCAALTWLSLNPGAALGAGGMHDEAIAAQVAELDGELPLAPIGSALDRRLAQVVTHLQEVNGHTLHYRVYLTSQVNAMAFPNGEVRVFAGLMQLLDDDELTFVIGHEIGHVVKGHGIDSVRRTNTLNGLGLAAVLMGVPGAGAGMMGLDALDLHFDRGAELEADRFGQKLLEVLDLNPKAGVTALTKLAEANGDIARGPSWFRTHPDPRVRADTLDQATLP